MQGTPHNVENVPPEREEDASGEKDTNPERQGPKPNPPEAPTSPAGKPAEKQPEPESIPGDQGKVPNPKTGR
jgi:hypothetical protein